MSDNQWEVWEPYSKQWTWGTGSSKMVTLEDIAKQQLVISSSAFRHPDMFYQLTWTQWLTNKQKRTFPTFYIYMGTGTYCTIKLLCVCNVLFASYFRTWYSKASNTNVLYYCEIMNLIKCHNLDKSLPYRSMVEVSCQLWCLTPPTFFLTLVSTVWFKL